jgi:hypothetical protein
MNSVKIIQTAKDRRFDVETKKLIFFFKQQGHHCEQHDTYLRLLRPASIGRQSLTPRLPRRRRSHCGWRLDGHGALPSPSCQR